MSWRPTSWGTSSATMTGRSRAPFQHNGCLGAPGFRKRFHPGDESVVCCAQFVRKLSQDFPAAIGLTREFCPVNRHRKSRPIGDHRTAHLIQDQPTLGRHHHFADTVGRGRSAVLRTVT